MEKKDIISKNLMEDLVDISLTSLIEETKACNCEQCRADIKALALNKLPPRYIVSTGGDIFVRVNAMSLQSQADITTAIMKAIAIVSKNPRHGNDILLQK